MTRNFAVSRAGHGHWDISDNHRRLFAIRGVPGAVVVRDERHDQVGEPPSFHTVAAAMSWITDELMFEGGSSL